MSGENPKITVNGVDFEWDLARDLFLCMGQPVVCMWVGSTMGGFMSGLQKMVGTERFNLAVQGAGRESVEGEWTHIISTHPTAEEGLAWIGRGMGLVGLGAFDTFSLDRENKEGRFRCKSTWEGLYQKALGVCWGSSSMGGKLAGYCSKIFEVECWAEQTSFIARGDEFDDFVVRPSSQTIESQLDALLTTDHATRADLAAALEKLRQEVRERELAQETSADLAAAMEKLQQEVGDRQVAEERLRQEVRERQLAEERLRQEILDRRHVAEELQAKLEIIGRQEDAIRAMSTPILRLWDGVLTMPVIGLVDSVRAAQMMERLLEAITESRARFTILDLTGVELLDTHAISHLLSLVRACALLGTTCLVSGISARMAQSIVSINMDLGEISTFNTLEAALRHAIQQSLKQASRGRGG